MRYSSKALPNAVLEKMSPTDRPPGKAGMTTAEAQTKIDTKSEKELQKHCANYLRQKDIWFTWSAFGRKTTNGVGTPDFLFAVDGRPIAVECKFEKGKMSVEQERTEAAMVKNGWRHYIVRTFHEFMEIVQFNRKEYQ